MIRYAFAMRKGILLQILIQCLPAVVYSSPVGGNRPGTYTLGPSASEHNGIVFNIQNNVNYQNCKAVIVEHKKSESECNLVIPGNELCVKFDCGSESQRGSNDKKNKEKNDSGDQSKSENDHRYKEMSDIFDSGEETSDSSENKKGKGAWGSGNKFLDLIMASKDAIAALLKEKGDESGSSEEEDGKEDGEDGEEDGEDGEEDDEEEEGENDKCNRGKKKKCNKCGKKKCNVCKKKKCDVCKKKKCDVCKKKKCDVCKEKKCDVCKEKKCDVCKKKKCDVCKKKKCDVCKKKKCDVCKEKKCGRTQKIKGEKMKPNGTINWTSDKKGKKEEDDEDEPEETGDKKKRMLTHLLDRIVSYMEGKK
ncbi:hypothetical protein GE061_020061 [Apolygus lucorum]|uniref:Uncharacterized protein n=1 Tax=Apolygus lucorum TaxID=248454 RepID=A0A6A4JS54_APOLU|nr:hypothetical protein GE061_020061 [Apolygus lucorum]